MSKFEKYLTEECTPSKSALSACKAGEKWVKSFLAAEGEEAEEMESRLQDASNVIKKLCKAITSA